MREPTRILVVCLGNICRSPMAAAVLRAEAAAQGVPVVVDSAGTGNWHVGQGADRRARAVLRGRAYDDGHTARQFQPADFDGADLVLAMDAENERDLRRLARGPEDLAKIRLFRSFDPYAPVGAEVPDPYGGDRDDFERSLDMIEAAARGLLATLARDER